METDERDSEILLLRARLVSCERERDKLRAYVDDSYERLMFSIDQISMTQKEADGLASTYTIEYFIESVFTLLQLQELCRLLVTSTAGYGVGESRDLWMSVINNDAYTIKKIKKEAP